MRDHNDPSVLEIVTVATADRFLDQVSFADEFQIDLGQPVRGEAEFGKSAKRSVGYKKPRPTIETNCI